MGGGPQKSQKLQMQKKLNHWELYIIITVRFRFKKRRKINNKQGIMKKKTNNESLKKKE